MDNGSFDLNSGLASRLRERRERMTGVVARSGNQGTDDESSRQRHGQGHGGGAVEGASYGGVSLAHAGQAKDWTPDEQAGGRVEVELKGRFTDLGRMKPSSDSEKRNLPEGRRFQDMVSTALAHAAERRAKEAQAQAESPELAPERRRGMRM